MDTFSQALQTHIPVRNTKRTVFLHGEVRDIILYYKERRFWCEKVNTIGRVAKLECFENVGLTF